MRARLRTPRHLSGYARGVAWPADAGTGQAGIRSSGGRRIAEPERAAWNMQKMVDLRRVTRDCAYCHCFAKAWRLVHLAFGTQVRLLPWSWMSGRVVVPASNTRDFRVGVAECLVSR